MAKIIDIKTKQVLAVLPYTESPKLNTLYPIEHNPKTFILASDRHFATRILSMILARVKAEEEQSEWFPPLPPV